MSGECFVGFCCVLYFLDTLVFLLVLRGCDQSILELLRCFLVEETGLSGNKFGGF